MSDFPSLDDFESGTTTAAPRVASVEDAETDFGNGAFTNHSAKFPDIGDSGDLLQADETFASHFPAMEQGQHFSGMISGPAEPYIPGTATVDDAVLAPSSSAGGGQTEPHVVTEWRERQAAQIERRDEASGRKKSEVMAAARQAIDDFYDNYNNRRDKKIAAGRAEQEAVLAKRDETTSGGTTWERIVKLIDVKDSKGVRGDRDVTRMRTLLLTLKADKNAPSAGL